MRDELEIIKDLMQELQNKMEYDENDLSERLGRKKPDIEVVKIEGELSEKPEDMKEMLEDSMEREESKPMEEESMSLEEDMPLSPEEELKQRLLKLRK